MNNRIATYNIMNLFSRAKPISTVDDWQVILMTHPIHLNLLHS